MADSYRVLRGITIDPVDETDVRARFLPGDEVSGFHETEISLLIEAGAIELISEPAVPPEQVVDDLTGTEQAAQTDTATPDGVDDGAGDMTETPPAAAKSKKGTK